MELNIPNIVKALKLFGIKVVKVNIGKFSDVEDDSIELENRVFVFVHPEEDYAYIGCADKNDNCTFSEPTKSVAELVGLCDYVVMK
jgi:hypothetical protein